MPNPPPGPHVPGAALITDRRYDIDRGDTVSVATDFSYDLAAFIPFRDADACARARQIRREEITRHPSDTFRISVIDDRTAFYTAFAQDLVDRIRRARDEGRSFVAILPVGPVPQYRIAAEMINAEGLSLSHVHTFNMDEYADQDGRTAPISWAGSFQRAMWEHFFGLIEERLRPPQHQIHFPTDDAISSYSQRINDAGGTDVCYGGIGWCGHIAFWEPHLAERFDGDLDAFRAQRAQLVDLHPITIMQNALHSFGGDWSWVPPMANTIGPADVLAARDRSFWLDGDLGGAASWQRFIARLVAHGPVTPWVPGSILQTVPGSYTMLGGVADDVAVSMA